MIFIDPFRCLHFTKSITYAHITGRQKENKLSFRQRSLSATTYSLNLNRDDRKKYEEKLITVDGTVLPDSCTLIENWKDNVKLLPDITRADIYNYLINTPSLYTNENLKAYKTYKLTTSSFLVVYTMLHIMESTICQNSALFKLK